MQTDAEAKEKKREKLLEELRVLEQAPQNETMANGTVGQTAAPPLLATPIAPLPQHQLGAEHQHHHLMRRIIYSSGGESGFVPLGYFPGVATGYGAPALLPMDYPSGGEVGNMHAAQKQQQPSVDTRRRESDVSLPPPFVEHQQPQQHQAHLTSTYASPVFMALRNRYPRFHQPASEIQVPPPVPNIGTANDGIGSVHKAAMNEIKEDVDRILINTAGVGIGTRASVSVGAAVGQSGPAVTRGRSNSQQDREAMLEARKIRNRESASRSRVRTAVHMKDLQEQIESQRNEIVALRDDLEKLKEDYNSIRNEFTGRDRIANEIRPGRSTSGDAPEDETVRKSSPRPDLVENEFAPESRNVDRKRSLTSMRGSRDDRDEHVDDMKQEPGHCKGRLQEPAPERSFSTRNKIFQSTVETDKVFSIADKPRLKRARNDVDDA